MRLNHYISASGYTSRRDADRLIEAGKVTVNGSVAALGTQVLEDDIVEIEGKRILKQEAFVYLVLNKPVGITCTTDREIEGNIVDFINYPQRIFHVGRLDKDSEGLILMTNNGDIVNEILRSHNKNEKDYEVSVNKTITEEFIAKMAAGVEIFNPVKKQYTVTDPCKITKTGKRTFNITLSQGLNRQIRNMCKKSGYRVVKLKRVRIMNIKLGSLPVGQWRHLTQQELTEMMAQLNRNKKTQN